MNFGHMDIYYGHYIVHVMLKFPPGRADFFPPHGSPKYTP